MLFIVIRKRKLIRFLTAVALILLVPILYGGLHASKAISQSHTGMADAYYAIKIDIAVKKLYLYENSVRIKTYSIASGKPGWPSPIGEWKITEKSDWGEGFGGRWMGLNVSWGQYGIHGTVRESSIGHAASHGCIRMFNRDVRELYDIVPVGTSVTIRDGQYGPFGSGYRLLRPGDRGADVLAVQQALKNLGYYHGRESGIYEDDLKYALYKFQEDYKLRVKYTMTYEDYRAMGFGEMKKTKS